jgi:hypothetical protein
MFRSYALTCVIAGLDPAIHPRRKKNLSRRGWTRGSSPRVTASELNKHDRNIHDPITTRLLVEVAP